MRKNKHRFFVISALAIIILALHPLVGLVFGDTSVAQPASYSFISIDIPNPSGQLGFIWPWSLISVGPMLAGSTTEVRL
jgi:hypothetical protein